MTAEMDVLSELNEKCALDFNVTCSTPPPQDKEKEKDDTDSSYVFVTSTDASTNDLHQEINVDSTPNPIPPLGEDHHDPPSFHTDTNCGDLLNVLSPQVVQDLQIQIAALSNTGVNRGEGIDLESSQMADEDNGIVELIRSSDTGLEVEAGSSLKADDSHSQKENGTVESLEFSAYEANSGEEIEVESSQMLDHIQIHQDNGIVAITESADTRTNHVVLVEAESSQKADGIPDQKEDKTVAFVEVSDTEAIPGVEIEVESSQKAVNILVCEENQIVATVDFSDSEANLREKKEVESSQKVEDIEILGQTEVVAAIESSSTVENHGGKIEVKSSQKVEISALSDTIDNHSEEIEVASFERVEDIQESQDAISALSDTIDNRSEEIEVASFERVEDIQESQDANLEAAACNRVNGREKTEEIENKSELSESQITSMISAKSEPDQPNNLVENIRVECNLGLALNVENSERSQVTISKDGENNLNAGEEQAGSSDELPILDPSGDNTLGMEQNLATGPCPQVNLKLGAENPTGPTPVTVSNEDGLPNSMNQDGPLDTNHAKDTVANKTNFCDDTIDSASVNCEIAILGTPELSSSKLVGEPKIELNEFSELNNVLKLDEGSETTSGSIPVEYVENEVLGGTVSENGDDMPIAQDESRISDASDFGSGSQLIPEENKPLESIQTTLAHDKKGDAPDEMRTSFSILCLNDPVLKSDSVNEDCTKFENVAPIVDDVQPNKKQVSENHDICLLGNTDLETQFENGNTEKAKELTFPSKNMTSESTVCISIECEEIDSTVPKLSNGDSESSTSQLKSVDIDSELPDNESSSVQCAAAKREFGDDVEITSSIGSRNMPGDECVESESEVLEHSLVNHEGVLNTVSDVAVTKTDTPTKGETEAIHEACQDEPLSISPEGSAVDALEGKNVGADVGTRPFYCLIRVPRFDDDNIREKIECAHSEVDRKTQDRDAIRVQIQTMRATWKVFSDSLGAAVSEERAVRDSLKTKRQEVDSVQLLMTKVKNAMSVEDIDVRIRNIEHMIEHETVPLKEEKQLIREIKQLKQLREQLSLTMGKQDELQQALDQKEQIEDRLKLLRKEVDLLRVNALKAESVTKAARKKCNEESIKLNELQSQFKAADKTRQEAYADLQGLKKQLYEKNKFCWKYRNDVKEANNLASSGDRERLQQLCINQVESMMELWNKNDEFRKDYIRCNMRSTLRRLRTLDGRYLGPNEEPPVLPNIAKERLARDNSLSTVSTQEREKPVPAEIVKDNSTVIKTVEMKNQTTNNKKPDIVALIDSHAKISGENEVEEVREVKIKQTKEEEELAAKAEELRKEEVAAKLKEKLKLEEKTKAKEALERKKRNAERAQAKAVIKARKEAEEREKQREKRALKKERKMISVRDAGNGLGERESAEISETLSPTEAVIESENTGKEVTATTRSQRPSQYTKQSKAKIIPPPLRNRGKRRMQPWMWVLLTTLVVLVLFFVGQQRLLY